jgi:hypothetical protein
MLSDDQIAQIDQEFAKQGREGNKPAASQQFVAGHETSNRIASDEPEPADSESASDDSGSEYALPNESSSVS